MRRIWPWSTAAALLLLAVRLAAPPPRAPERPAAGPDRAAKVEAIEAPGARLRIDPSVLLPGEPRRGLTVFHEQGCAACHAVWGMGGSVGPDLGRVSMTTATTGDLVAAFWNHGPRMWEEARKAGTNRTMSLDETADLIAFLTFIKTLDPPGDPVRGRAVLAEKRCLECHAGGDGRIPQLVEWAVSSNPIAWAQRMWTHAGRMQDEMSRRGIPWPQLEPADLADIIAYVRTVGRPQAEEVFLRPGSPRRGEKTFFSAGCDKCHVIEGHGRGIIDLTRGDFPKTLSGVAALLWNKYPRMRARAGGDAGAIPPLSAQKMADVATFLFSVRHFGVEGDARRGREVFEGRGCATCHTAGESGGIPIRRGGRFSTIEMTQAMWNHGPKMAERMAAVGMTWPMLRGDEVFDLVEYLNEAP